MRLRAPVLAARVPQLALGHHVRSALRPLLGRAPPPAHAGAARTRLRLTLETGAAPVLGPRPGAPPSGGGGLRLVGDWPVGGRALGFGLGGGLLGLFWWGFVAGEVERFF